jgi:hypothetical protein
VDAPDSKPTPAPNHPKKIKNRTDIYRGVIFEAATFLTLLLSVKPVDP